MLSLWTDDEYDQDADTGKITARLVTGAVFPTASTYASVVLPDVVNQPGTVALQPWFGGTGLYFTQDFSVAYAAYGGAHAASAFADPTNWTAPVILLQKDTTITNAAADVGKVAGLGEASVAQRDGRDELYFVYAIIRSIDPITGLPELDFQIGRVGRR